MSDARDPSAQPALYLSNRQVEQRCTRLFKQNQLKQLRQFCVDEPRARMWTLQRISQLGRRELLEPKVRELYDHVDAMQSQPPPPASPAEAVAEADPEAAVLVAEAPPASAQWDEVDLRSLAFKPLKSGAAVDVDADGVSIEFNEEVHADAAMPREFGAARSRGDYVAAGEALLAASRTLGPGQQIPIRPVEFRELAAELAMLGRIELVVDLCWRLPTRVTAPAMADLGAALQLGARLREPMQWYRQALLDVDADDDRATADLDKMLIALIKSTLG